MALAARPRATGASSDHPAYRADIDGLRAVAVTAVVAYHAFPGYLRGGFVGVDIFFVISGFLIGSIILKGLDRGTFSFVDFYSRRIRRIFPALVVVLAACLVAGWFLLLPDEFEQLGKHVTGAAAFVANFLFNAESGYFDVEAELKPLLHLWSLGIEEQFYIFLPIALVVVRWLRWPVLWYLVAITVLSFAGNLYLIRIDRVATFYLPVTRFWELLIGVCLAYFLLFPDNPVARIVARLTGGRFAAWRARPVSREVESVAGLALILAAAFLFRDGDSFPGWRALLPTYGAALLIAAGPGARINRFFLANPAVVYIGLISYPLYLWHWPLLSFARILEMGTPPPEMRLALVAAAVALAALTYHLIEKPIRTSGRWRATLGLMAASTLVAFLGFGTYLAQGFTFRDGDYLQAVAEIRQDRQKAIRSPWCHYNRVTEPFEHYRKGIAKCLPFVEGRPNVLVLGDSHAADVWVALSSGYPEVNFLQATGSGCIPSTATLARTDRSNHCRDLLNYIRNEFPDLDRLDGIVMSARWVANFPQALPDIQYYGGRVPVAVFGPTFEFTADATKIMARNDPGAEGVNLDRYLKRERFALDRRMQRFFEGRGIPYVSKIALLCPGSHCPVVDDKGDMLIVDYGHWSRLGSAVFGKVLREQRVLETTLGVALPPAP